MKRILGAILVLLLAAVPAVAGQPINETHPASGIEEVIVENLSGSVDVRGWARDEVEITGTLGDGSERLEVRSGNGRLRILVKIPRKARNVDPSYLEISVPARLAVQVETVSAKIKAADLEGELELTSVSGSVNVAGRPAALEASSVSGRVTAAFAPDGAELSAVSGSVEVFEGEGSLEVSSVSGDIVVHGGALDGLEASTTSGSILCEAEPQTRASFELDTMSGNVTLVVPRSISADFELSTFSGNIKNQLGPKPKRTSKYAPGKTAEFSTGSGGARISLNSFSGTVKLLTK
jgi:hypothetical protein